MFAGEPSLPERERHPAERRSGANRPRRREGGFQRSGTGHSCRSRRAKSKRGTAVGKRTATRHFRIPADLGIVPRQQPHRIAHTARQPLPTILRPYGASRPAQGHGERPPRTSPGQPSTATPSRTAAANRSASPTTSARSASDSPDHAPVNRSRSGSTTPPPPRIPAFSRRFRGTLRCYLRCVGAKPRFSRSFRGCSCPLRSND